MISLDYFHKAFSQIILPEPRHLAILILALIRLRTCLRDITDNPSSVLAVLIVAPDFSTSGTRTRLVEQEMCCFDSVTRSSSLHVFNCLVLDDCMPTERFMFGVILIAEKGGNGVLFPICPLDYYVSLRY